MNSSAPAYQPSLSPSPGFLRCGSIAGWIAIVVGGTALTGWCIDNELLKGTVSGIAMKSNTAILFLISGVSLFVQSRAVARPPSVTTIVARYLGAIVCLVGLLTASQHLLNWNLGIDQLFFVEPPGEIATTSPNRMGPPASLCFTMVGLSLFLSRVPHQKFGRTVEALCILVGVVALIPALGYLFRASELYTVPNLTGIALPSALTFLTLSVGIFFITPGPGIARIGSSGAGGVILRRLLLPAIILPPLLGYVRTLGEHLNYYDAPLGRSLLITAFVLIFVALVWSCAKKIENLDDELRTSLLSERGARAQAENASRLKDQFLATLSHELRTPLNAILGWTQLLRRSPNSAHNLSKGLDTIERNAKLQAQLIEDLLDMSRVISGKLRLNRTEIDLLSVVRAAVQTVALTAKENGISIVTEEPDSSIMVYGDSVRLQQVVWNILSNALKFTPRGGKIRCVVSRSVERAIIRVTDTGDGIDPELIGQIFDRFTQADGSTTRRHGGLGIGLSIVKELVQLHGGTVTAGSLGKGCGSTFEVTIPIVSNQRPAELLSERRDENSDSPSQPADFSGISVLVIDDALDSLEFLRQLLTEHKATPVIKSSAEEGIETLNHQRFDLLISDIGMPGMDGYKLIKTIRTHVEPYIREMPAIALTAFAREEDKERAMQAGFTAHIAKPVSETELLSIVEKLLISKILSRSSAV